MTEKTKEIKLNAAQQRAVEAPHGPLLIVAGAGTGKTRTLTSRILHLIKEGINPERICAITFTNKAAGEMMKRVAGCQLPVADKKPYIGTFHSLGARILRRECRSLGREPNFAIFDDHDSFDLVKKAVKEITRKQGTRDKGQGKDIKKSPAFFAQKISEKKNLTPPAGECSLAYSAEAASLAAKVGRGEESLQESAVINSVFNAYESALAKNNAFDFDDLIEKPVALFAARPATLKKHQAMFDAILVDEWQDINPKQYELVKFLAGGHRNLSVVGDDEQTIYSWRYADVKMFLNFPKEWTGTKIEFLEENYRSTKTIIEAASAVVQNNQFRTPKKLWTESTDGEPISLFEAWGENDEAAWIAEQVSGKRQAASGKETAAILYRTNAQSRAIEQQLIRREIPYRIYGGLKFYERREVKDAVAALRYASNPRDELSRERLEKNLSKKKFAEFKSALEEKNGAYKSNTADAPHSPLKPAEILNMFFQTFGYFDYLEENFINADERMENIEELIKYVADFENLADLLEKLSLLQSTDDAAANQFPIASSQLPVHLSTIHLAKGLEFDTVFIAGAAEGLLPHIRSLDDENQLEEERRLMYVAMTRARKKLHISFYGMASRFINEIPEEYVELAKSEDGEIKSGDNKEEYVELD
jgi:DNA helicase II / ATP-dependent DNA helicase PcrA